MSTRGVPAAGSHSRRLARTHHPRLIGVHHGLDAVAQGRLRQDAAHMLGRHRELGPLVPLALEVGRAGAPLVEVPPPVLRPPAPPPGPFGAEASSGRLTSTHAADMAAASAASRTAARRARSRRRPPKTSAMTS